MTRPAPGYNSQKIKPHRRSESGRAITSPHPKLPSAGSGSELDSASGNMSSVLIVVALAVSDLLPWAGQVRWAAGKLGGWIDDRVDSLAAIAGTAVDLAVLAGLAIGKQAEL